MTNSLDRESLEAILKSLRDFSSHELTDARLRQWDREDVVPLELIRRMYSQELGLQLLFVPAEYEGLGGSTFDVYRCCEQMARIDLGLATAVLATFLGSDPIVVGGTPEQKSRWLTRIATEGALVAYGATEPSAGSDLSALKSTARRVEQDGRVVGYVLNGSKQWISNGGIADFYTILAQAPDGPTWFVVDKGTPGLSHGKPEEKHGIRLSNTAALTLEDVQVDVDRMVGGVEGQGLNQAQAVFGYTRVMVASFGLGAGWSALDRAISYSMERIQGGGPLCEKQGYTHKLIVPWAVRLEAARAFIESTAAQIDAADGLHGQFNTEGAIAKYLASESGNAAAEASIQALGGYGYVHEFMVEKIKRDVRITTIYEGTSEILEMTISRDRWQLHLKTKGSHYHDRARQLESLAREDPECGAGIAVTALHALATVLEHVRSQRLTRSQHVLFRLGRLTALAESAGVFAERAHNARQNALHEKTDRRFDSETLAAMSRVYAREAALEVASDGMRWVLGAGGASAQQMDSMIASLGMNAIQRAQAGLMDDLDRVADALYGRETKRQ